MFFNRRGFDFVIDSGIAMPIMNRKDGKIRSAGVKPCHGAWSSHQGGCGPELSTKIIPTIVNPLYTSNESNRCVAAATITGSTSTLDSVNMLSWSIRDCSKVIKLV